MSQILLRNLELLDPAKDDVQGGHEVLVEHDRIKEVSAKPIKAAKAAVIDCGKRTLMPGLIDSHVHVTLSEVYIRQLENIPLTLMTARAIDLMRGMLDRGFTTVRDTGGADWGIKTAVEQGLVPGPRLFIAGRAIGPTGPCPSPAGCQRAGTRRIRAGRATAASPRDTNPERCRRGWRARSHAR